MKLQTSGINNRVWAVLLFGIFVSLGALIFINSTSEIFSSLKSAQYDDSYITYRYVQNLQLGNGFRFNASDSTNSASSFLYTILLYLISTVTTLDIPKVGILIGISSLSLSAGLVAAYSLARSFTIIGALVGIASATILVSNPSLLYWACSGMETTLFLFFMILAISLTYFTIRHSPKSKLFIGFTSLTFLGLCLIRWEGAILALFLSSYVTILSRRGGPLRKSPFEFISRVLPLLCSVVAISLLLAFYRVYYGHFLPDSIAFKKISDYYTQSPAEIIKTSYTFMRSRLEIIFLILTLVGFSTPFLTTFRKIERGKLYAELVPGLTMAVAIIIVIFGAYADEFRYMAPIVGIAVLLLTQSANFSGIFETRLVHRINALILCIVLAATYITVSSGIVISKEIRQGMRYQYLEFSRIEMGRWIEKNLPHNSLILSEDIGALSFYSPSMYFFDASGLTNHELLTRLNFGEDYSSVVVKAAPQYMVGTTDENFLTGAEWIFDNPEKYFDPKAIRVRSNCSFEDAFMKQKIYQLPSEGNVPLSVVLWKLTPTNDCDVQFRN